VIRVAQVPPTQLPLGSRASSRSSPATANSFSGAFASSACRSETLISVPLRFFIRRSCFRRPKKTTAKLPDAVARRSWVLRGVNYAGVAEEARTRGFVPPAFAGFAFVAKAVLAERLKYRGVTGASSTGLNAGSDSLWEARCRSWSLRRSTRGGRTRWRSRRSHQRRR